MGGKDFRQKSPARGTSTGMFRIRKQFDSNCKEIIKACSNGSQTLEIHRIGRKADLVVRRYKTPPTEKKAKGPIELSQKRPLEKKKVKSVGVRYGGKFAPSWGSPKKGPIEMREGGKLLLKWEKQQSGKRGEGFPLDRDSVVKGGGRSLLSATW